MTTTYKTNFRLCDAYDHDQVYDDEAEARKAYAAFVASGAYGARLYKCTETIEDGEPSGDFEDEIILSDDTL